jgi:hypothetical protein
MVKVRESGYDINPECRIGSRVVLGWQFQIDGSWFVVMRCDCGKVQVVNAYALGRGKSNSCRCGRKPEPSVLPRIRDEMRSIKAGSKIGRRVVLGKLFSRGRDSAGKTMWTAVVQCECGNIGTSDVGELSRGHAESCGCLIADAHRTHGFRGRHDCDPLYSVWCGMRERCNRPSNKRWDRYGGRGIKVCPEWNGSHCFPTFREWAHANGWQPGLELDRRETDGNYEPDNCRWIPQPDQARNRSNNRNITAFGETKCLAAWIEDERCAVADVSGLTSRLKRGMTNEEAISTPVARRVIS